MTENLMTWLDTLAGQFVWPWAAANRAGRLLDAMKAWQAGSSNGSHMHSLYQVADGYYRAGDWIGVESTYIRAREYLDLRLEVTSTHQAVVQTQALADMGRARARMPSATSPATGGWPCGPICPHDSLDYQPTRPGQRACAGCTVASIPPGPRPLGPRVRGA